MQPLKQLQPPLLPPPQLVLLPQENLKLPPLPKGKK